MTTLSVNALAELTGFDRRTITRRLQDLESTPGPGNSRQYQAPDALRRLYGGADGTRLDPQQERAALDKERRLALEIQRAKAEGDLVSATEIAAAWSRLVHNAKAVLLGIPARLAPELAPITDPRRIAEAIRTEIYRALDHLSGDSKQA